VPRKANQGKIDPARAHDFHRQMRELAHKLAVKQDMYPKEKQDGKVDKSG
jgi:hypothetical protein